MIGTLLRRSLWHQRYLLAVMLVSMIGFEVMIITIAQAIDQGPGIGDLLAQLPKILQNLIHSQIGDVTFPAFPAFGFEHPVTMGGGIAYVLFVATQPAGERDRGLADLILARPLTRRRYLAATTLHVVIASVAVPLFLLIGTVIGLALVESRHELPWWRYIPAAAGLCGLMLAWGGIALLVGCASKRRATAVMQVVTAIMVTFLVYFLGQFASVLDLIALLSPFTYFHPIGLTMKPEAAGSAPLMLYGLGIVTTVAAFVVFERRDL